MLMTKQENERMKWCGNAVRYVNFDHLLDFLGKCRINRKTNNNPYMDNALLNIIQLLEANFIANNPLLADSITIGGCGTCKNKQKHQKCSCCRRNRYLKDNYEEGNEK